MLRFLKRFLIFGWMQHNGAAAIYEYAYAAVVEQCCYLNLKQLLCIRLAAAGCIMVVILTAAVVMTVHATGEHVFQTGIYFLVPSVVSYTCMLGFFSLRRRKAVRMAQAVILLFIAGALLCNEGLKELYEQSFFIFWLGTLAVSVAVMAFELRMIFRDIEKGENLCWN